MNVASGSLGAWSARRIVATTFPILVVLAAVQIASGLVLETFEAFMEEYRLLAVLVPVVISVGGNLGAIFSARLSTRLHLGTAAFDPTDRTLWANVGAILALAATVFGATGLATWVLGLALDAHVGLVDLLVISLGSGLVLAVVAIALSLVATYASFHFGVDPDDTTIPIVTNLIDVVGVLVLFAVSRLVLTG